MRVHSNSTGRTPVRSSNLRLVGYDAIWRVLKIEFHHGGIYHYYGVPAWRHEELMAAPSQGRYHAEYLKGSYSYDRIR